MGKNLADGMALVFSIWGGDTPMEWLTHDVCKGGCGATTAWTKVSNIRITELYRPDPVTESDDLQFLTE